MEGVDYSYSRPPASTLWNAGKRFIGRYLSDGGKGIHQSEWNSVSNRGLAVFFLGERDAGAAKRGYAQGVADAKFFQAQLNKLDGPSHKRPIYFCVDYDATDYRSVDAYFDGAASVIGRSRVGAYGGIRTIRHLQANGKARWFFQTAAWSYGARASGIHLHQYRVWTSHSPVRVGGYDVDLVRNYQTSYGQYAVGTAATTTSAPSLAEVRAAALKEYQAFLKRNYGYTGAVDGVAGWLTWTAAQKHLKAHYGYTGAIDGAPGVQTYKALQRLAQKGGYTGPIDGVPGIKTWTGVKAAV